MGAAVAMTGKVNLSNASDRNAVQEIDGIEAVVERIDVDIIHVQQYMAVGAPSNLGYKLPFAHFRSAEIHIAGHIFQKDLPAEEILYRTHSCGDVLNGFFGVGQWQKIVHVLACHTGPA